MIGSGAPSDRRAHVVHVVHRFATGGMENGIVNLVNRLPDERFRHTILALAGVGAIARRIKRPDVAVESLDLPPGPLLASLPRLWRRFRALRPSIVHTRNVGTLEAQLAAACAGVAVRVHGEHGWEVHDLVGSNRSLLRTRRMLRRLVHAQVALSTPTYEYLRDRVGVPVGRLHSICNGVDTDRFHPRARAEGGTSAPLLVGYVGRLADVKNPILLIDAFERAHALLSRSSAPLAARLRLEIVGDGPLAAMVRERTSKSALRDAITLAGDRNDIPEQMRRFDVYALPSLAEGISNTLLEAMASGLPCVATRVGGNDELVDANRTGLLVESGNVDDFAQALAAYLRDDSLRSEHGANARKRAVERFGIDRMIEAYENLYTSLLAQRHALPDGDWQASGALRRSG
jgi:sugar transferase (PEP-CTERM/EpsH1 system associated)